MNAYQSMYEQKRMSAQQAATLLPESGNISAAFFAGMPVALLEAISQAASLGQYEELNFYYMHSTPHMADTLLNPKTAAVVRPRPFYMGPAERALVKTCLEQGHDKLLAYMPGNFSQVPRLMAEVIGIDTFMLRVSPMDEHGYFSLGVTGAYSQQVMRHCRQIIVEVNEHMPRTFGDSLLHISDVTAVTECHQPLDALALRAPTDTDRAIGQHILGLIEDRACVQFGIGGVPNVIAQMLSSHKDLGVHSELLADGLMELMKSGAVTNRYKKTNPYKTVFNVAMGSQNLYDFIDDNPSIECYGADYVNDPFVIAQNDQMISVNAFIEIDLLGQVDAEVLMDRQFSAPGGQLDFVRGATLSKGGKSFLASTATAAQGKVSRIVPRLSSVTTDPRAEVQYVATEFGLCNLQGKSTSERARALIGIAAPEFQAELTAQAKSQGLI